MKTINAYDIERDSTLKADLCIIGGGAAGIAIAKEFIQTQYNVLLLESGSYEFDPKTQSLYDFESVGHPVRAQDGYVSRNRYLGGSTNTWSGRCAPLNSIDFEQRDWVPNSGWPINKFDLDEYYQKASSLLQLPDFNYFCSRKWEHYVIQYRPDFLNEDILRPDVFLFSRKPINMRLAYVPQLQDSSNIRICINSNATEIEPNESSKRIGRVHVSSLNGNGFFVDAKVYILACGGWENSRLLLLSRRHSSSGLGNQYDVVGRYYMEHPKIELGTMTFLSKMLKSPIFLTRKPIKHGLIQVGIRLSDQVQKQEKLLNHYIHMPLFDDFGRISKDLELSKSSFKPNRASKESDQGAAQFSQNIQHLTQLLVKKQNSVRKYLNIPLRLEQIPILNHFEHAPNRASRIMLSHERDALGQNQLKVDLRISSEEKRCIVRFHQILGQVLKQNGIGRLTGDYPDIQSVWPDLTDSSHHMGTTRMSHNPKEGVVDMNCKVHGISNLYIASSSVFPTAGHVNPTLTIVAIALRLSAHLKNTNSDLKCNT